MTLEALLEAIPAYAKDTKINLSNVLKQAELTPQQLWGTAVACAVAARNPLVMQAIEGAAAAQIPAETISAAKTAASIMAMNNVYYRFLHLTTNEKYSTIPARLRMQGIRTHGIDQIDFELWCAAVSAINNCPACVASHEKVVREKGVAEEAIAAAVRIAAVIHAAATAMDEKAASSQIGEGHATA